MSAKACGRGVGGRVELLMLTARAMYFHSVALTRQGGQLCAMGVFLEDRADNQYAYALYLLLGVSTPVRVRARVLMAFVRLASCPLNRGCLRREWKTNLHWDVLIEVES